jgi:hypothetical protein
VFAGSPTNCPRPAARAARVHLNRPARLHRERRNTAGDSGRILLDRRAIRDLDGDDRPKVTALSARPDVALSVDGGDTPDQARALSIRGQASVEIVDGVAAEYLAAARKTMTAEAAAEFEENVRGMYDQMARIAITPPWVRYYDFGAGRMP